MAKHIITIPAPSPEQISFYQSDANATVTVANDTLVAVYADPRPLDEQKESVRAELADLRWRKAERFTYEGVETWAHSAAYDVTSAVVSMQMMPDPSTGSIPWKLNDTTFRIFAFAELVAFGQAIRAHVQACFTREAELIAQISGAADADTLDSIDIHADWPEGSPA